MRKLLFTTSTFNLDNFAERAAVELAGYEIILNPYGKRLTESQVTDLLDDSVVGMVAGVEPLTDAVMRGAKALKIISRCGIGLDNVDLQAAEKQGILVFSTPDAPTHAVAELTLAHILSLARRLPECDRALKQGRWQPLMGRLLSRQTVGVIGFGRIGKMVANLLHAFGSRVLVHDMLPVKAAEAIEIVTLDALLAQSDIVTLHLPYEPKTHHFINEETLAQMKSNSLLINVARGGLIDEEALLSAVQENRLGGVALDCFEAEPYSGPLLVCDRVQMTSHMGSYAQEARAMMEAEACASLVHGLRQQGLF